MWRPTTEEDSMVTLFVRHGVADYDAWRKVYDEFAPTQDANGVRAKGAYTNVDDENDVTVWHRFDDRAAAEAFRDLPELRDAMARAGVAGQPEIWITNDRG
jgi:quinol monooxygenase YgiN